MLVFYLQILTLNKLQVELYLIYEVYFFRDCVIGS